jgi:signal transduction histidine kinase
VSLSLEVDPTTSAVLLLCDANRVVQVLWHLFVCARHVAPSARGITLRAHNDTANDLVRFEVEALRANDGAPRARAEDSIPKPELTIARGLVALHGGSLDVGSDAGSLRFSFAVPVSAPSREAPKERVDGNGN